MAFERKTTVLCDLCGKRGPGGRDELEAWREAKKRKWQAFDFDCHGNRARLCRECCPGRTAEDVFAALAERAEAV